ncbi:MAG: peptidoglycan-binding domain-containing protein, partial [Candidatus Sericytochromatia bacterium]|nr:peptidoglycan-binding domain-containing protein [Candidatus Sericytochromatia bacterium]
SPLSPEPGSPPPTPAAPSPTPDDPNLTADEQALARTHGLLATKANLAAFTREAEALEAASAPGPGSSQAEMITELQQLLAAWGYSTTPSGRWDEATTDAVTRFKQDHGLVASYRKADGQPAVHPFIDEATKRVMIAKLEAATPPTSAPTPPASTQAPIPPPGSLPAASPPNATPPAPAAGATLTAEEAQLAQQHNLLATRDNVTAFAREAQRLETSGAMGPGALQADLVRELQQVLTQLGFATPATGTFDAATEAAVLAFKRSHQLVAPYKLADGTDAVHPFIDEQTQQALISKLGEA